MEIGDRKWNKEVRMEKLFLIPLITVFVIGLVSAGLLTPTSTLAQPTKPAYRPPPPIITDLKMPQPKPVTLNVEKTALLVLELSELCADPKYPPHKLNAGITKLLDRARAASMLIVLPYPVVTRGSRMGKFTPASREDPQSLFFFRPVWTN